MAHLNSTRFPDGLDYGVEYGPDFVTEIATTVSKHESRDMILPRALCSGDCSKTLNTPDDYRTLLKFFRSMGGKFHSWRFKDWSDFECALAEGVLIGLTARTFQLAKLYYTAVGFEEVRYIQAPIAAGMVLKDGATTLALTTDYDIDDALGIITTTADRDAATLTWSGEFDNACRFDTDSMRGSFDKFEAVSWPQIPIQEVRLR